MQLCHCDFLVWTGWKHEIIHTTKRLSWQVTEEGVSLQVKWWLREWTNPTQPWFSETLKLNGRSQYSSAVWPTGFHGEFACHISNEWLLKFYELWSGDRLTSSQTTSLCTCIARFAKLLFPRFCRRRSQHCRASHVTSDSCGQGTKTRQDARDKRFQFVWHIAMDVSDGRHVIPTQSGCDRANYFQRPRQNQSPFMSSYTAFQKQKKETPLAQNGPSSEVTSQTPRIEDAHRYSTKTTWNFPCLPTSIRAALSK